MGRAWNGWYHCIGTTYGTWAHGDARGFRTRHHRRHVEGDYRTPPPPGAYERLRKHANQSMRGSEVVLTAAQQSVVCDALVQRLFEDNVELAALCVAPTHFHALCRFPNWADPDAFIPGLRTVNSLKDGRDPVPRHLLGRAKKNAAHVLGQRGMKDAPGPLWAKRPRIEPVADRRHQLAIVRYIRAHGDDGAIVWSMQQRE